MTTILLLQGANMNWLGTRQPEIYGTTTAAQLDDRIRAHAAENGYTVEIDYINVEGEAINRVYRAHTEGVDAIVMNPAGYSYAGYALRDAIKGIQVPVVEVHISNLHRRGFESVTGEAAEGVVMGFGLHGYILGLEAALHIARGGGKE